MAMEQSRYFIAITSVAIAGIIILYQSNGLSPKYSLLLTEVILLLLLLIGFNTLGRVAISTVQSIKIWKLRKHIQTLFAEYSDDINNYKKEIDEIKVTKYKRKSSLQNSTSLRFLVIVINTFLVGAIIFIPLIYFGLNLYCVILILITIMYFTWILLSKYYELLKKRLTPWESTF